MPFSSKSQMRACWAEKKRNPDSTWDCHHWAHESSKKERSKLPEKKRKSFKEFALGKDPKFFD